LLGKIPVDSKEAEYKSKHKGGNIGKAIHDENSRRYGRKKEVAEKGEKERKLRTKERESWS
jgi:hypothetical protein